MDGPFGMLNPVWAGTAAARTTSEESMLAALLQVEAVWARVLADAELAPSASAEAIEAISADPSRASLCADDLARAAVGGGNPVIPLLAKIREALHDRGATDEALHRGATSQDVLDTALVLVTRNAAGHILEDLQRAGRALARLCEDHRETLCVARSLTQHALPISFSLRTAVWLDGVSTTTARLRGALDSLPLQWGGAVGTQAALVDLAGAAGATDDSDDSGDTQETGGTGASRAADLTAQLATALGVPPMDRPWHTQRQPILELASALAGVLAALGKIAGDVLTLQRPEIGELREPTAAGRGGSSAMPQKQNPVLSTMIRSAALAGPGHLATLHQAAAAAVDERPDGAWHAEWPSLTELLRLTGGAAARAAELLEGLQVRPGAMDRNLRLGGDGVLGERIMARLKGVFPGGTPALQQMLRDHAGSEIPLVEILRRELAPEAISDVELERLLRPDEYLGRADAFIDASLSDAERLLRGVPSQSTRTGTPADTPTGTTIRRD